MGALELALAHVNPTAVGLLDDHGILRFYRPHGYGNGIVICSRGKKLNVFKLTNIIRVVIM
ncbi:MAG: hypothetical protein K6T80_02980 [Firmicutes bacterium]|nr:hypothetical protein [Bacillota bacterium]